MAWDPYATLPPDDLGVGKAQGEASTTGPEVDVKAKATQIAILTVIGCIATIAVVGKLAAIS